MEASRYSDRPNKDHWAILDYTTDSDGYDCVRYHYFYDEEEWKSEFMSFTLESRSCTPLIVKMPKLTTKVIMEID